MSPKFDGQTWTSWDNRTIRRRHRLRLLVACFLLFMQHGLSQSKDRAAQKLLHDQHFVCNTGYRREDCHGQCVKLAAVLMKYRTTLPPDWTWVLVRSGDWGAIVRGLDLNEKSPAFTVLAKRQTFLNEALFQTNARESADLLQDFGVPLDRVLEYAVTHELGHAFCMEGRERETTELAEELIRTGSMQCAGPQNHKGTPTPRDTVRTLGPPK